MNKAAEYLRKKFDGIASTILKEFGFPKKYWSELILTLNYLRNWLSDVGRNITLYEAQTQQKPNVHHL